MYRGTDSEDTAGNVTCSPTVERPSTRVAYQLAAATGQSVVDLQPLAESIDPDALDAIFAHRSTGNTVVTFSHDGCIVTVSGPRDVAVEPVSSE